MQQPPPPSPDDAAAAAAALEAPEPAEGEFVLASSNVLSACTFAWVVKMLWRCVGEGPENVALRLSAGDRSARASRRLRLAYERDAHLVKATWRAFGPHYSALGLWKVLWALCTWTGAFYLLMEIMKDPTVLKAVLLLVVCVVSAIAIHVRPPPPLSPWGILTLGFLASGCTATRTRWACACARRSPTCSTGRR